MQTPSLSAPLTAPAPVLGPPAPLAGRRGGSLTAVLPSTELTAVRAWARSRGYPIDETSGVPLVVLRTYREVHAA